MGMPMKNAHYYHLLRMAGRDRQSWDPKLKKALKPFTFFVLLIYHPQRHSRLARFLNSEFDVLDNSTGNRLLFFAPVDPPEAWRDISRSRSYYELMTFLDRQAYGAPDQREYGDPDIDCFTLSHLFNIALDKLPCLIVTTDFTKDRVLIYRTSAETIQRQLAYLGTIAKYHTEIKNDWETALRVLASERSKLNLCSYDTARNFEVSLADVSPPIKNGPGYR
jgi:hypothetical protein